MAGRFYDGRSARAHAADANVADGILTITTGDQTHEWPLADLRIDRLAGEVRLSHPSDVDARFVLPAATWATMSGKFNAVFRARRRRAELTLVGGLAALGLSATAAVFFGVPAMAGPLARATPIGLEDQMGRNFDAQIGAIFRRCEGEAGQQELAQLGWTLGAMSESPYEIRVRAVEAPMLNAFALPGGPVLVTDDLIRDAESPDELAAVVAHEVAHIERRHVMQAVWRNLGVGLVLDLLVGGGTGAGQQAVILAGQMSNLKFGREAEAEADARGQALLHEIGFSSKGMAPFFERLGAGEGGLAEATEFLATHPDSARRARAARAAERDGEPAFTEAEWAAVKATCSGDSDEPVNRLKRRFGLGRDATGADKGDQVRQH